VEEPLRVSDRTTAEGAPAEQYRPNYRWLADQCRQAARTASTETERADLLARAKLWNFLAEHHLHHPALNEG
jgi:hypothetical protein